MTKRSFSSITFCLLASTLHNSFGMQNDNLSEGLLGLPGTVWRSIATHCTPTNRNALRKVCTSLALIARRPSESVRNTDQTPATQLIRARMPFPGTVIDPKQVTFVNSILHGVPSDLDHEFLDKEGYQEKIFYVELALRTGCFECAATIIDHSPDIAPDCLKAAVENNNPECVEFLLHRYAVNCNQIIDEPSWKSPFYTHHCYESLLHRAVRNGTPEIVQQLVNCGADTTIRDLDSCDPCELAQMLLEQTPHDLHKTSEYQKIIKILIKPEHAQ